MRTSRKTFLLLGAGFLYGTWYSLTGLGIPCPFHLLTGLKCPACGVTRMCVRLLRLDFPGAFRENPGLFLLSPAILFLLFLHISGKGNRKTENLLASILILLLLAWGVFRNL